MTKNLLIFVAVFLYALSAMAQGHSFVRSFDDNRLSDGPTWDIKPLNNGFVYCTNDEHLLIFHNGAFRVQPFETEIRCTHISDSVIYAGGVNEIGFFKPLENGKLEYTSLYPQLDSVTRKSLGNVWKIYEYDHVIYFVADAIVLKYINGEFSVINPGLRINCSSMKSGVLYISGYSQIKYLMGNKFKELPGCELLDGKIVKGFASYKNGILAVTEHDGVFFHDGDKLLPLKTSADTLLKSAVVFCTADNDYEFAVGTVKGGVAVIDKNDFSAEVINTSNGLKDNTVISLSYSSYGSLWAGLNSGVNEILLSSPLKSICTDDAVGAGTGIAETENGFYLTTNRGVYFSKLSANGFSELQPIKGLETAAWRLYKAFGNVYCLHDRGIFRLDNLRAVSLGGITGFWGMVQITDSVALAATYSELFAVKLKKNDEFDFVKVDREGSFYDMAFDGEYVWLHNKGVCSCVKAKYDSKGYKFSSVIEFTEKDGLPSDKKFNIQVLDGKVYAVSMKGVAVYDATLNRFVAVEKIGALDCKNGFWKLSQNGNSIAGLSQNNIEFAINGKSVCAYFDERYANPGPTSSEIVFSGDTMLIIATKKGFHFFDTRQVLSESDTAQILSSVYLSDSLIWQSNSFNLKYSPQIPYKQANIKFVFGNRAEPVLYSYRISEDDSWSTPAPSATKEFTSLREGRYNFEVVKTGYDGRIIGRGNFSFRVLPPWYRTWPMYVVYLLLAVLITFIVYKAVKKHYRQKQSQLEAKNKENIRRIEIQHEMESAADKQRISELEKQKLKDDLEHKTTELAYMALSLASKNKILSDLKNEIDLIFKSEMLTALLKQKLSGLNSMIDGNIQNDSLIDHFEEQFDLLHNNFIRKMKSAYPQLSRSDYMLCAYIRMELSTKEIAQILNISVRGVESQKYRLKKKIALEEDLNTYLKEFENKEF